MSAGALKSWMPLLLVILMLSVSFADDSSCPACKDFLNNPHAHVIMTLDETTQTANIVVYYEDFTQTPARLPVGNSIVIVELTNSSGELRQLYKTYTNANGTANFSYAAFAKPCVNIKALYCPFCTGGGTECGFAQCLSYSKIHNESDYYSNIAVLNLGHPIQLASDIPDSSTPPSSFNPNLYFPDLGTVQYCAPPVTTNLTPPLCLPLIIIFSLLAGAMYMSGRNPFSAFSLGGARVGKHIRYQARGRGFSMNVQSLINAGSSIVKVGKAAAKGELGKNIKAEAAQNSPGKLVNLAGSKMGLAALKETNTMTKGMGLAAKSAYLDSKMEKMKGGDSSPGLKNVGGQMVQTPGGSGTVRGSDFTKPGLGGKPALNWGAIGMFLFSQSAIGRMVDGYRTIGSAPGDTSKTMWAGYVNSSGASATRAMSDKVALDALKDPATGGLKVIGSDGSIRILANHTDGVEGGLRVSSNTFNAGMQLIPQLDAKGKPVLNKDGTPVMVQAAAMVTVKSVAATDDSGNPVMKNPNAIQVNGKDVIANKDGTFTVQGTMRVNGQDVQPGDKIPTGRIGADGQPEKVQTYKVPGTDSPGMLNAKNELVVGATVNAKGEIVGGTVQKVTTDGTAQAMLNANRELVIGATVNKDGKVEGGVPVPMTVPTREQGSGISPTPVIPGTVSNPQGGDTTPTLLATGVKDGRLVTFEPQMKVESTTTTYMVPGAEGKPATFTNVTTYPPGSLTPDGKPQQTGVVSTQGTQTITLTPDAKKSFEQSASMTVVQTLGGMNLMDPTKAAAELNSTSINAVSTFEAIQKSGLDNIKNAKLAEETRAQEMIAGDPKKLAEYQANQREASAQLLATAIGLSGATTTASGQQYMTQMTGSSPEGVLRTTSTAIGGTVFGSEEKRYEAANTITADSGIGAGNAPAVAAVIRELVIGKDTPSLGQYSTAFTAQTREMVQFGVSDAVARGTITQTQADVILHNPKAIDAIAQQLQTGAATALNSISANNSPLAVIELAKLPTATLNNLSTASANIGLDNPKNDPAKINLNVYENKPSTSPELQATLNYHQTLSGAADPWERLKTVEPGQFDSANMNSTTAMLNTRTVEFSNNAQAVNIINNLNASDYMRGNETPYQKAEIENNVEQTKKLALEHSTSAAEVSRSESYLMNLDYRDPMGGQHKPSSIEEGRQAYIQQQNQYRQEFLGALNPDDPNRPDSNYQVAAERAAQAAEACRKVGDEKGYLLWSYQGAIVSGVGRDQNFSDDASAREAFRSVPNVEGVAPGGYFTKDSFKPTEGEKPDEAEARRQEAYKDVVKRVVNDVSGKPETGGWEGYNPIEHDRRLYGSGELGPGTVGAINDKKRQADMLGTRAAESLAHIAPDR